MPSELHFFQASHPYLGSLLFPALFFFLSMCLCLYQDKSINACLSPKCLTQLHATFKWRKTIVRANIHTCC